MKRHLVLVIILVLAIISCKKEYGTVYLRITGDHDSFKDLRVTDGDTEIPADGNYHAVSDYLQISYTLENKVIDSITNWRPTCLSDQLRRDNISVQRYIGEFERVPEETWYTLTPGYRVIYLDPAARAWPKDIYDNSFIYYGVSYIYLDNSNLAHSSKE